MHQLGCDMEHCPFCGGQLISCECVYQKLKIDVSPGSTAYENGLTDEQCEAWEKLLAKKGRTPYIQYPNICAKCGGLWPGMLMVPDKEWQHYVELGMRGEMLCKTCYTQIKAWIDASQPHRKRK
jgi:hypothetical protein